MRSLVVTTFLTLNGVMQAPGAPEEDTSGGFTSGGWLVPYFDEQLGGQMDAWFQRADSFLLGRGTYQVFAAHWPHVESDDAVTVGLQTKTKHVASRTLTSLEWETAQLLDGDVTEAVRQLTSSGEGELQVHGSPGLIDALLAADLVDELRVDVMPVLLGAGLRLFDGTPPLALEKLGVDDVGPRTSLRFRVLRSG